MLSSYLVLTSLDLGTIVSKQRGLNMPSLQHLVVAIMAAIQLHDSKVKEVQQVIGMSDYKGMFAPVLPKDMDGIVCVKVFKIFLDDDKKLMVLYKNDSTIDGWFPRPLEPD